MTSLAGTSTLLPAGVVDVLPPDAAFEASIVERVMAAFAARGYQRVKPPLVEFEDSLLAGTAAALADQTFRLMDPISQRMLALRPDMTMQVARIACDRLARRPRPLRLGYAGQVVRVRGSQLRPSRQFTQVGAEIIGAAAAAADAEVIDMATTAIADLGIGDLTVDLGMPALASAMIASVEMAAAPRAALRQALDRKDVAEVKAAAALIGRDLAATLAGMVMAAGPAAEALPALMDLALPADAAVLRAQLAEVVAEVRRLAPALTLTIDSVERRGFEYHSGVTFAVFSAQARGEVGRGGRYVAGHGEAATGVSLFMDTLLAALTPPAAAHRVYLPAGTPAFTAAQLRREGWVTVAGLAEVADVAAEAVRLGCAFIFSDGAPRAVSDDPGSEGKG